MLTVLRRTHRRGEDVVIHDETADVVNPVDVERALQKVRNDINRGVRIVNDAERAKREAQRVYDRAYARAFIAAACPQTEKRYHAELATIAERDALDEAEVAYSYARSRARALSDELSALQSLGQSVRLMYGTER